MDSTNIINFTYTIEDEDGLTDMGMVDITFGQIPPVADDEAVITDPGVLVNVDALNGDDDPDGDNTMLAITEIFDSANPGVAIPLTVGVTETLTDGTMVALLANGTLDITPGAGVMTCLLYTSPSPRDKRQSRMPSSA